MILGGAFSDPADRALLVFRVPDPSVVEDLISIITHAVTDLAHIASPADLAKILARQARAAKAAMPDDLKPVKPLLEDYRQALGLAFSIDDEKGARFFRSSLVQSIFYALFAAWILWDREASDKFSLRLARRGRHQIELSGDARGI